MVMSVSGFSEGFSPTSLQQRSWRRAQHDPARRGSRPALDGWPSSAEAIARGSLVMRSATTFNRTRAARLYRRARSLQRAYSLEGRPGRPCSFKDGTYRGANLYRAAPTRVRSNSSSASDFFSTKLAKSLGRRSVIPSSTRATESLYQLASPFLRGNFS